jgi:hypothetical protein
MVKNGLPGLGERVNKALMILPARVKFRFAYLHFEDEARRIAAKHRQAGGAAQAAGLVADVGVGADG